MHSSKVLLNKGNVILTSEISISLHASFAMSFCRHMYTALHKQTTNEGSIVYGTHTITEKGFILSRVASLSNP